MFDAFSFLSGTMQCSSEKSCLGKIHVSYNTINWKTCMLFRSCALVVMYYLQHERPCCIGRYKLEPKATRTRMLYLCENTITMQANSHMFYKYAHLFLSWNRITWLHFCFCSGECSCGKRPLVKECHAGSGTSRLVLFYDTQ